MHNLNVLENARRQMRVHLYPVDKLTLRILHFHIMSCGWWWCCTFTCLPILYLCLYLTALSYSTSLAYMMSVYIQINSRTKQETARCRFFVWVCLVLKFLSLNFTIHLSYQILCLMHGTLNIDK